MRCLVGAVLAVAAVCMSSNAETWYAKASNYGLGGLDGRSEATAWGTLQDAHDYANDGDTILVLPGDYDQGSGTAVDGHTSRLVVSKPLTFASTVPKAAHIVGRHGADADGRGSGAVRCICVTADGAGTAFKDFTIRDGATPASGGSDPLNTGGQGSQRAGGGLHVLGATGAGKTAAVRKVYLVDCVISNCVATWGGAMFGGTAIRCLLKDNAGVSWGEAACQASLWNTVVACNRSLAASNDQRPTLGNNAIAVNCTISGCQGFGADRSVFLYNCVFVRQESTEMRTINKVSGSPDSVYASCYGNSNDAYPVLSPATGDFRPRAGSPIVGGGVTSYLTDNIVLPEGTEMKDYNGNPLDLMGATCDAGAVQGAVTPQGGRLVFDSAVEVNGFANILPSYSYADSWPSAVRLRPTVANFFRVKLTGFTADNSPFRYSDYNGLVQMLYPPFDGTSTTVSQDTYAVELWCSPTADAASADGSSVHPFRTLQAAMDCIADGAYSGKYVVVRAMPGDYNEGEATWFSHRNRLVLPDNRAVLVKSTGGAAVTTIWGEVDPSTANDEYYPGCGAAAMRCVAFAGTTSAAFSRAVQGFTLANGRSNKVNYKTDAESDRVGGVYVYNANASLACQVLDCTFTNCVAVRGGAAYHGWHSRCRYYDCHGYGAAVSRYTYLSSCYLDSSCTLGAAPSDATENRVLGTSTSTLLCTCPKVSYHANAHMQYGNLYGDQSVIGGGTYWGSLFRNPSSVAGNTRGYTIADPQCVDFDGDDFRVTRTSPAISGIAWPERGTSDWGLCASNLWKFASSDVNAKSLRITDGKIMAGCDHDPVRGLYVTADKGGLALSGASTGFAEITDGLSVTVSAGNPGARPCIGYVVNGVTNLFDDAASGTVTAADAGEDGLLVAALYSNDWYVNADSSVGDDAKTGFTPKTAKRTLAAALLSAASGDTVHAAAGTYSQGSATPSGSSIAARALVPAGVTLEGAGAGETFIVGATATTSPDSYGRGADAVHCVYLETGATVRKCTLTGGRTNSGWSDENVKKADWHGAGACGAATSAAQAAVTRVEDCIVSNCVAMCGGAGWGVTFVRSHLFKCRARRGSATEQCGLVNAVVDDMDSEGDSGICVNNCYPVFNSTIGPDIRKDKGGAGYALFYQSSSFPTQYGVVNTVVLGSVQSVTLMTNCVYTSASASDARVNCRQLTAEQIAIDEHYRPDIATSALVDQGLATDGCGETDVYGGQRIYNGRVDIGAVEADWRDRYAADIGRRRNFAVTVASPDVEESAGVVQLPAGASLDATWSGDGSTAYRYRVTLRLAAGSAVTVMLNGETLATCDTEGVHELTFSNALPENCLTFTCSAGSAEIVSAVRESGMMIIVL